MRLFVAVGLMALLCILNLKAAPLKLTPEISYEVDDGVLTITGTGEMPDFEYDKPKHWRSKKYDGKIRRIVVGEGITSIGSYNFDNPILHNSAAMVPVEEIVLPSSLETIGLSSFSGLLIRHITLPENLVGIAPGAFKNCQNLQEIVFPKGLKGILTGAFAGCKALKTVDFNNAAVELHRLVFDGDKAIATVKNAGGVLFGNPAGSLMFADVFKDSSITEQMLFPPVIATLDNVIVKGSDFAPLEIWQNVELYGSGGLDGWSTVMLNLQPANMIDYYAGRYVTRADGALDYVVDPTPVKVPGLMVITEVSGGNSTTVTNPIVGIDMQGDDAVITYIQSESNETWNATLSYDHHDKTLTFRNAKKIADSDVPWPNDDVVRIEPDEITLDLLSSTADGSDVEKQVIFRTGNYTGLRIPLTDNDEVTSDYLAVIDRKTGVGLIPGEWGGPIDLGINFNQAFEAVDSPNGGLLLMIWDAGTEIQNFSLIRLSGERLANKDIIEEFSGMRYRPDLYPEMKEKDVPYMNFTDWGVEVYDPEDGLRRYDRNGEHIK